jgi:hypothetical protein
MKANIILALVLWGVLSLQNLSADDQVTQEIQAFFDRMEQIYTEDPNGSNELFDELWLQDENVLYLSEQFVSAFYGRKQVMGYWQPSWNTLYGYRELYSDLRVTLINPNLALANVNLRYDMHAVTRTPLGGQSRLSLVLRKVGPDWKIQQFYETPMSLLSQGRRIHEQALDPGFADFARSQNPQYDELVEADENIKVREFGVPWAPRPRFRPPVWKSDADEPQNVQSGQ